MCVHPPDKWPEPSRSNFYVGVYQYEILGFNLRESLVVSSCKTVVAVKDYPSDLREFLFHHLHRSVRGGTVSDYNLCVGTADAADESRKELLEISFCVPVQYDYGSLHLILPCARDSSLHRALLRGIRSLHRDLLLRGSIPLRLRGVHGILHDSLRGIRTLPQVGGIPHEDLR